MIYMSMEQKLIELEQKIDKIYVSVEKTRKYFMWTGIITLLIIVVPLILMTLVLPSFISNYVGNLSGLGI